MASQDWFEKDFYAILGVPQDADEAAIKKAYRKLARKHHPDQNPGDAAAEQKFKEIGEANSVLSDPEQRREYDAIRQMARGGARFTAGGPGGTNGGFEDVFSSMFGGAGGSGGTRVRYSTGGASQPDLVQTLPKTDLPTDMEFAADQLVEFAMPNGQTLAGRILEIGDDAVKVDFNHPLADLSIEFEVEIVRIL